MVIKKYGYQKKTWLPKTWLPKQKTWLQKKTLLNMILYDFKIF